MTIETKFNEKDQIFFLHNGKVVTSIVRGLTVEKQAKYTGPVITYLCNENEAEKQVFIKVLETSAFKSKEELLKSL